MFFSYQRINNLVGWFAFLVAALTYCLTIEPTASFWDCPEFTTTGYKLEVGHPPGAPFFMLTANLFTQLTSDVTLVAKMVNYMSALMSAACILFLFWTITHLVKKLFTTGEDESLSLPSLITIMGAGLVGALAYTFSDTFWFSAVESEVYAYSSLFTAVVFWLILKWEDVADKPHSDRWLILIAYLTGLSIGVHLLNLLCIPAIVLVYYFKKNPQATFKGSLLALLGSMVLVAVVLYGIVPGVVKVGGWFELFFVNTLGFSFNSGLIFYILLLCLALIWGVYESFVVRNKTRMNLSFLLTLSLLGIPFYGYGTKSLVIGLLVLAVLGFYLFSRSIKEKYRVSARTLNTCLLCLMMIMVGYSSYAVIVIRSAANTPMDQNSPEDIFTLGIYLGREQYGERPLFYGQTYNSERKIDIKDGYCMYAIKEGAPIYVRKEKDIPQEKDSYTISGYSMQAEYAQNMLFPRMYSESHSEYYRNWVNIQGKNINYDRCGENIVVNIPTQWENIKFFFKYQLDFMYWRYFFWNFVGRQNDIQGHREVEHGNWITGISFMDKFLIGNSHNIPTELMENKGRNVYYGLPLLLGVLGMFWQFKQGQRGIQVFSVVFFLFFMTGIAIVLYLNQTPLQPRERDYAYAGSFYAFAIWIGMGVAGIAGLLKNKMGGIPASVIATLLCLLIPIQMVSQTWDDHDRSGRYACRDFGQNYLMSTSVGKGAILFTDGDNATFPLWYNQEVEGFRTDVRVCNLSYLQTDWYIDQMKRPYYDSPGLPVSFTRKDYVNSYGFVQIRPEMKEQLNAFYKADPEKATEMFGENPYELKNILKYWIRSDKEQMRIFPTDSIVIKLDKGKIMNTDMWIPDELSGDEFPEYMQLSFKGKRYFTRSELMLLDIIVNNNWERPMYMVINISSENYACFDNYIIQEGFLHRITPFNMKELNLTTDTEKTYDLLMNRFKWGGTENENLYLEETTLRMYNFSRRQFAGLTEKMIEEGKYEQAIKLLERCEQIIPHHYLPHDYRTGSFTLADCYYRLEQTDNAIKLSKLLADKSVEYLRWYLGMEPSNGLYEKCLYHFYLFNQVIKKLEMYEAYELNEYIRMFYDMNKQFENKYTESE